MNDQYKTGNLKVHVVFVRAPLSAAARDRVLALATDYDDFEVVGREIYWRTRGMSSASLIKPAAFSRAVGMPGTARNVTTVRKLAEKLGAA